MSSTIKTVLEKRLRDNVAYPIKFENIPFTTTYPFIQPDYEQDTAYRKTIGGINNIEELGTFYIWVYSDSHGRFEMDNIINELIPLFFEYKSNDVITYVPQILSPNIVGEKYRGGVRVDVAYRTTY
ncbi:MAG: hypothetical protein U9N59_08570 [Campylobacterota bacterium]|nr:hypothetical protein [Campylobacterota bacterium]